MVSNPLAEEFKAESDSNVTYKTVWTKKRKTHVVRGGETLSGIAGKYNVTMAQVKKWNRMRTTKVLKGQKLMVYVNVPTKVAIRNVNVLDNEDETVPESNDGAMQSSENSSVAPADSGISDSENGEAKTCIPAKKPVVVTAKVTKDKKPVVKSETPVKPRQYVYHIVQPGDTLWSIAQRYEGITVDDIKKVNNIHNSKSLKPGTKLKIKVKA
jgi:membrane-bound lytic murein transglycosylase D